MPTAEGLSAVFDRPGELTVGIEEELMVLDADTLDFAPRADELLAGLHGEARFKGELMAAQIEHVTAPAATVGQAATQIAEGRRRLARAGAGSIVLAAAGAHPFANELGELSTAERYRHNREEYGIVARRQLVFGLHVHVRVPGAQRAVAVYNGMRAHLPELAALAANSPFHAGRDTGLASIRPKIAETLPRQGIPPTLADLGELAEALRWGERAGALAVPGMWWWELRLHPVLGTVEVRVPDQQTTVADTAAVAAVVHSLVRRLADRFDNGEPIPLPLTWRIQENRWSACRHGLTGTLAALDTGAPRPARKRLRELLAELAPVAADLGCADELEAAVRLAESTGAERQRAVAVDGGPRAVTRWLAEQFCSTDPIGALPGVCPGGTRASG